MRRCERGRVPSDSSSGISDDTLSSGSDSGIEAGENWSSGLSRVYHGVPVSYSSDQVNVFFFFENVECIIYSPKYLKQ